MKRSTHLVIAALVILACAGSSFSQDAAAPIRRSSPSPTPTATPQEEREEPTPARAERATTPEPTARPTATQTPAAPPEEAQPEPPRATPAEAKASPAPTARAAATPRRNIREEPPVRAVEKRPRGERAVTPRPSVDDWSNRASRPTFDLSSDGFGQIAATIRGQEKKWQAAIKNGNVDVIEELLADDFVGTSSNGRTASKSTMLATLRRDKNTYQTARVSGMSVRSPSPGVAVVTGVATETGLTADGKKFRASRRFTDTWVERGGRWKCVASHTTELPD